jgi:hypothetical protein
MERRSATALLEFLSGSTWTRIVAPNLWFLAWVYDLRDLFDMEKLEETGLLSKNALLPEGRRDRRHAGRGQWWLTLLATTMAIQWLWT